MDTPSGPVALHLATTQTREQRIEALFRRNYAFVRRMLRYWGVPPAGLDDAAQDVFVVVTRNLERLEPAERERSWLLGIARRTARNHRRSTTRTLVRRSALRAELAVAASPSLETKHARAALAVRLLEGLSERQRVVVVLSDLEGWTAPEIAASCGLSVNTVYSRLRLARTRLETLRAQLSEEENNHA